MILIVDGQMKDQFSYDPPGFQQGVMAYMQTKSTDPSKEVDLVIDTTKLDPQTSSMIEEIGQFLVPYEGSPEMLEVNVEELAASIQGGPPGPPPGGPGMPPPGPVGPGMPPGGPGMPPPGPVGPGGPGMAPPQGMPPAPGMPPGGPGMPPGGPGMPPGGPGGPTSAEQQLRERYVQRAMRIPPGKKGGMPT